MARIALWPIVLCALVLAGCGGGGEAEQTTPAPSIPSGLAQDLASRADTIASAYEAGEVCEAAREADDLNQAVVDAINSGEIPVSFQETLQATANKLVDTINCPPPEEEKDHKGKGKGKGEDKQDGDGETTTVLDTTTTTTTTTLGGG